MQKIPSKLTHSPSFECDSLQNSCLLLKTRFMIISLYYTLMFFLRDVYFTNLCISLPISISHSIYIRVVG